MITRRLYSNLTYYLFYCHVVETTRVWYVVFRGWKHRVYESRGVCNECVIGLRYAAYQTYSTRMQAEKTYVAFLEHQNQDQKAEHVFNKWCWKDWAILMQFVVIVVLLYNNM
jgi:hypothetical protein